MRGLVSIARIALAGALMLGALSEPLRAQEGDAAAGPRGDVRGNAAEPRAGRVIRPLRDGRELPPRLDRSLRELSHAERRVVLRKLRRMPPSERLDFFRDFERNSEHERREQVDALRRRPRELPEALRNPEMRQRLREMSPQERRAFFRQAQEWREMSPRERGRMRTRLEKFGALSDSEQRALVDEKFGAHSPEQRDKLLRDLRSAAERMRERRAQREAAPETP
ncbi:MAG: DUF3106 domain-containing protein [Deltaproteobacteria bacterium]|nr:DUF3106 domain-containing protein [Deltaproteobacteria bacterium]